MGRSAGALWPANHDLQSLQPLAQPPIFTKQTPLQEQVTNLLRTLPPMDQFKGEQREELILRSLADTLIQLTFERAYRIIFGSQIEALIAANHPGGTSVPHFIEIFENAKKRFPTVHSQRTFEQWLAYIQKVEQMVGEVPKQAEASPVTLQITERGKEFLHYMVREGLQPKVG